MWAARALRRARPPASRFRENQHAYATQRIRGSGPEGPLRSAAARLSRRCRTTSRYDKIASVGMFEHVGRKNLPVYFGKICRLLKPGGLVDESRHHAQFGETAKSWAATSARSSTNTCSRAASSRTSRTSSQEMAAQGLEELRRRKPAAALRADAAGSGSSASRAIATPRWRARREDLSHLAHLHGGLGARVRARLDVDLPGARRANRCRTDAWLGACDARIHLCALAGCCACALVARLCFEARRWRRG